MDQIFRFVIVLGVISYCFSFAPKSLSRLTPRTGLQLQRVAVSGETTTTTAADHDILVRALRGEVVRRPPVWLLRQVTPPRSIYTSTDQRYFFKLIMNY